VLVWAAFALFAALILPYLSVAGRRHSGGTVQLVLALAVGLALAATGAATTELDAPGRVLHLIAILALVCGLVGLAGLVLFNLLLPSLRVDVPSILRDVLQLAVAAVAVMVCLRLAGLDVLPLLTTSAVLTAVIGLALQAPIANVFGGLALQLDRTLGQGDWIETEGHSGRIVEIGWRSTRVVTKDGDTVFVPNSHLLSGVVLNLSRPTTAHRTVVRVSVHDRHPPAMVRQLLMDAIRDVPGVLDYPPADVLVVDFAENALVYGVRYWLSEFERQPDIESDVRARLWYATRRAGLEVGPPSTVLTLPPPSAAAERALSERAERIALLRGVQMLAPLEDSDRERLADRMRRLEFTAGEPIFYQGTAGDSLYVVERGEVGVSVQADGASAEVARLGRGEIFGEMSLLTGEPRTASCIACTEVTCYMLGRAAFEELLAQRPEIAEGFSAIMASRHAALTAQREGLSAAARIRLEGDQRSRLLDRMRDLFRIT
jgi:small-conductance mechanosensitive channel/CRP-like cAMP-binding protein